MAPKRDGLVYLYRKHILNTRWKERIYETEITICHIKPPVKIALNIQASKVTLTSISLKHIYDKHIFKTKQKDNFDFIIKHLQTVIKNPDIVKLNKKGRRGDYCFIKEIDKTAVTCTLQKVSGKLFIVTAFILTDKGYLRETKTIWKL